MKEIAVVREVHIDARRFRELFDFVSRIILRPPRNRIAHAPCVLRHPADSGSSPSPMAYADYLARAHDRPKDDQINPRGATPVR
eukprot:4794936-Prymnesium_polylepis.1